MDSSLVLNVGRVIRVAAESHEFYSRLNVVYFSLCGLNSMY